MKHMHKWKIVIYKDKSYKLIEDGITWEYENDPDWFMTLKLSTLLKSK